MSNKVELTGKIIRIGDTQSFDSGFQKREIVIECQGDSQYSNPVPFEAKKDKCEWLDKFQEGQEVSVSGYLSGNYWEKGDRYFLCINLSYIKAADGAVSQPASQPASPVSVDGEDDGTPY